MPSKHLLILLTLALATRINAQGYGDAPDPEPVTVTSAPVVIDCGPPQPLPTLAPLPTFAPAPRLPTFEEMFSTVAPQHQGYDQAPPQLPILPSAPKIPTFNELFPPAPIAKSDPYAQPKIEYAPVAPAASYPTAPPAFTFPPPMRIPTFAELFPSAPTPPALTTAKPNNGYDVGPPAVQPQEPYSNEDEDMDGDDVLLQPVEGDSIPNEKPKATLNPEKARAKLEKLRMRGAKTFKVGTKHHVRMHNIHEHHKRHKN